jgi:undecaprenyl-diphosphatase
VTIVVNESAGGSGGDGIADRIRGELPMARVVTVDDATSLDDALAAAASGADVIGIVGGDGSINAAAGVAHAAGKPLLVIPGGTLNHFARDVGITGADDAIEALRVGEAVAVDVSAIDGKPFLNTASFGVYSDLVDLRERFEPTLGKWPALVLALARVLRTGEPVSVELDGTPRRLWMVFVGNCRYEPPGFAPAWRERLDDGVLDVRLVDATRPFARLSLVAAVLTGRLRQSQVYEEFPTRECRITRLSVPRLARDGETFDGAPDFVIEKRPDPLSVYALRPPSPPDSRRSHRPIAKRSPSATTAPAAVSHAPACS